MGKNFLETQTASMKLAFFLVLAGGSLVIASIVSYLIYYFYFGSSVFSDKSF